MSTPTIALLASAVALLFPLSAAADDRDRPKVQYDPLVLTGHPAPGGRSFGSFPYHSYINDQDYTVFLGAMGPAIFGPDGVFLAHRAKRGAITLSSVARLGEPLPGQPAGVHMIGFDINHHRVNAQGQVTFEAYLAGPGILSTGDDNTNAGSNWIYSNGQLTRIAQFVEPAAGVPGANYRYFGRTTLNDLGHVAFAGGMIGAAIHPGNDSAFWYGEPGNLQLLAREGEALPGSSTLKYGELSGFEYPVLSAKGKVAFGAKITGPGMNGWQNTAILVGTPGNLQVAALSGQPAPHTTTTFSTAATHTPVELNNNGEVTFAAILGDGTRALYAGAPGDLRLLARTGQPAPGVSGGTYDFFFGSMLNDRGDAAFLADTTVSDETALAVYLAKRNKSPQLIAARGQPAPGAGGQAAFGWFISSPIINKDGQVAFFAQLEGEGSRGIEDYGIFATGHDGDLRLIARVGDEFEVAQGDLRTIAALSHAGIHGAHILSFNQDSDLSFLIKFTDGSEGLFTATVLPEPASLVLFALALPLLRRRHPR